MNESYQLVKTRLQEPLINGQTRCHLCPWRCKLSHGQRGFCQAHVNRNGTLYNISYGIISAIDLDRIESKPVYYYQPGTQVLSVGSYGCSFRCDGCHNLEISWGTEALDLLAKGQSTAVYTTPQQLVDTALRHGAQGIAFTYSEPVVWLEYILDIAPLARKAGLYTVYVTNSFVTPEALELIAPHIDVLCSDIKSMNPDFYHDICPVSKVEQILDSLVLSKKLGMHIETRTNIIPGKNDSPEELAAIAQWIAKNLGHDSPWHLTRFFPAYKLSHLPATPSEILHQGAEIAKQHGLTRVMIHDDKGCDCATDNQPVSAWLSNDSQSIKQCQESCCGSEGILLKKFEKTMAG